MRAPAREPRQAAARERSAPARASLELPQRLVEAGAGVRPVAVLERPEVTAAGGRIRVLGVELETDQARALWAELGAQLGEADRHRRPRAWGLVERWLDRAFRGAVPVPFLEARTRARGEGLAVRVRTEGPKRLALVRVGIFQVAWLHPRRSGAWTGPIADYFPGASGLDVNQPDALVSFTSRRIKVSGELLEGAPLEE